ncbi:MAG: terpene cyclase/mutase family protein [Planctomycetes bacterium]|nr:terpene cyclase/mutase family protein [Planctomycetota bacterium]
MRNHAAAVLCLFLYGMPGSAGEPQGKVAAPDIQDAVQRGLEFLTTEAITWKEARRCASCHHAPMMIWSLSEAKKQGYAVDDKALTEVITWVLAKDDPGKVFPNPPPKVGADNVKPVRQGPLTLALAFAATPVPERDDREGIARLIDPLLDDQAEDGSWSLPAGGRPPLVDTKETMTLWTLLALKMADVKQRSKDDHRGVWEKGLKWLAANSPGDSHQAAVLHLLLEQKQGKKREELRPQVDALLTRQNADGGWSQTKDMPSDAYATGQTLFAMGLLGMDAREKSVQTAQAFLLKTQQKEGSWPMVSRPTAKEGKGAKDTGPITYVGSAWGTIGLMRSAPRLIGGAKVIE